MREALLTSAAEILEAEGPDALSVRRIATAAGVAPMGVYNHFDSKNGIIEALFIQGFERLRATLARGDCRHCRIPTKRCAKAAAATGPSPSPTPWRTGSCSCARSLPSSRARPRSRSPLGAFDSLVAAVVRAMAAGVLAVGPPTETAQVIWSSIHGWVSLELAGMGFVEDQDAGFELGCRSLLRGLRP